MKTDVVQDVDARNRFNSHGCARSPLFFAVAGAILLIWIAPRFFRDVVAPPSQRTAPTRW